MLRKASVLLFSAAPVCLHVSVACVSDAATHVFMASCSSLRCRVKRTRHSLSDTLHLTRFLILFNSLPLPSPSFPFLSESQLPATSLRRSESCLSSREMGPAVCETADMRYEKWEMREQILAQKLTDTYMHAHTRTHTEFMYKESSRTKHLSLPLTIGCCSEVTKALWGRTLMIFL